MSVTTTASTQQPWRYRCPNGHTSWSYANTKEQYHCRCCSWTGSELVDWKNGEPAQAAIEQPVFRGGFVGAELRAWRERYGITQPELAALVGVHRDTIRSWEGGRFEPSDANAFRLKTVVRRVSSLLSKGGRRAD